jgi:hypothetical protein
MSICGAFLNCTETIGLIIGQGTTSTTGSLFLTFFFVLLIILAVAMLFGIQMEYTAIIILPLLLGYMSYYSEFIAFGALILIYLALILTKNFIFK